MLDLPRGPFVHELTQLTPSSQLVSGQHQVLQDRCAQLNRCNSVIDQENQLLPVPHTLDSERLKFHLADNPLIV